MNNVSIIGRLGTDPEMRFTKGGKGVASFSLAVDNPYREDNEPDWVSIEVWAKTAETVSQHKVKGDQVAITGRLTSQSWTDDDGNNRRRIIVTAEKVDFLHMVSDRETADA